MAREYIPIQMSPIWSLSSTTGVHKVVEAIDSSTISSQNQTDHIPGQYSCSPSVQVSARGCCGTDMAIIQSFGFRVKQEMFPPVTRSTLAFKCTESL